MQGYIHIYIKDKHIEVMGHEFLLGELSLSLMNISQEQINKIRPLHSKIEQLAGIDRFEHLFYRHILHTDKQRKLELAADDVSYVESYTQYIWSYYSEMYEKNGISYDSFLLTYLNGEKSSAIFNAMYGEGGEREVAKGDINKYLEENIARIKYLSFDATDEEGNPLKEGEELSKIEELANSYYERLKSGEYLDFLADEYNATLETSSEEATSSEEDKLKDAPKVPDVPKKVTLVLNENETAFKVPDGVEIYVGDTIVIPLDTEVYENGKVENGKNVLRGGDWHVKAEIDGKTIPVYKTTNPDLSRAKYGDSSAVSAELEEGEFTITELGDYEIFPQFWGGTWAASDSTEVVEEFSVTKVAAGIEGEENRNVATIDKNNTSLSEDSVKAIFELNLGEHALIKDTYQYIIAQRMYILEDEETVESYVPSALNALKGEEYEEYITGLGKETQLVINEKAYNRYNPKKIAF